MERNSKPLTETDLSVSILDARQSALRLAHRLTMTWVTQNHEKSVSISKTTLTMAQKMAESDNVGYETKHTHVDGHWDIPLA